MITSTSIQTALAAALRKAFPDLSLHLNHVENSTTDYMLVIIDPSIKTVDRVYFDRSLAVELTLVLLPDVRGRVDRAKLYQAIDTLDGIFLPVFHIEDRYITVQDAKGVIVDEVLRYTFTLNFTDYRPEEPKDLMDTLYINRFTEEE